MPKLDHEEYVEQVYFFRTLGERLKENMPLQELLASIRDEVLVTTRLPMAIGFLLDELMHAGQISTAMARLPHYFTPFQTYLLGEAESERGRFDMRVAIEILRAEADFRSHDCSQAGLFIFQFETLCRNRLRYDRGLEAVAGDPWFDEPWKDWILELRRRVGMVDFADMIYVASEFYVTKQNQRGVAPGENDRPPLFGEKEGRIALANRQKDPLLLFSALQRHLAYPAVPRLKPVDAIPELVPQLARRMERLEHRLKLMEDEQQGGIDLSKFYMPPPQAEE